MLRFRVFCGWSYVTFGPVKVRKRGRERWWYANCPNISHRRNGMKRQVFLFKLIFLPYWFRNQLKPRIMVWEAVVFHWSAGMTVQQGISHLFMEASWVHPGVQIADDMKFSLVTELCSLCLAVLCWDPLAFSGCLFECFLTSSLPCSFPPI